MQDENFHLFEYSSIKYDFGIWIVVLFYKRCHVETNKLTYLFTAHEYRGFHANSHGCQMSIPAFPGDD